MVDGRVDTDRGQAVLGAVVWLVLAAVIVLALSELSRATGNRVRAQTAADAAALAGAAGTDADAREAAERNDAVLITLTREGEEVQVTAEVDGASATARAERLLLPESVHG